MSENTNCLSGLKCQKCGSLGPFRIETTCMVTWSDDGTDEQDGHDFDSNSYAACLECDANGTVATLMEPRVNGQLQRLQAIRTTMDAGWREAGKDNTGTAQDASDRFAAFSRIRAAINAEIDNLILGRPL